MINAELIKNINKELQTEISEGISYDQLLKKLSEFINHLIQTDFEKLVFILYKTDINEAGLKKLLKQNPDEDAAPIIATLILEREQQKFNSRSRFRSTKNISDEEKW